MKKKSDLITRNLNLCIEIERLSSQVYHELSRFFPNERDFWHNLAMSEENHMMILEVAKGYHEQKLLPESFVHKSLLLIEDTYANVRKIRKSLLGDMTLQRACEEALRMEHLTGESYFQEVLTGTAESRVIASLKKLLSEERLHATLITDFMKSRNLPVPEEE
ncbi:MAG: hypothetical protein M1497_14715 [Nitrospirae bacterium]|nr:hypothetical protein [Nitrospirota bacterium]